MPSYNKVVLIGHVTRDPELRYIPSGTAVADTGLAVNEKYKDGSGNWVENANFFDVVFWARTAEVAAEYAKKGALILVEGRLKQETWEKDGQKHSKVRVVCERLQLLGTKNGNGSPKTAPPSDNDGPPVDSEIPF